MAKQFQELTVSRENSSSSQTSVITEQCEILVSVVSNKQQYMPSYFRQLLTDENLTLDSFKSIPECIIALTRIMNNTKELNETMEIDQQISLYKRSSSLIVFVVLIGFVSLISIIGNLCLAKVLYSKRYRLIQTDRIVLCLALSKKEFSEKD